MKAQRNKKGILLECLIILFKYSDEENPISTKKLMQYLEKDYGHKATRQVLAENLRILESLGFEIVNYKRRYYLVHPLLPEEVEVICHSIMANNGISQAHSLELIEKLKKLQSEHFAANRNLDFHMACVDKRDNKEVYLNISQISKAISEKRRISFEYYRYDSDMRLVLSRDKRYHVVPCRTVAKGNRFYLITYNHKDGSHFHYRIDKIKNIKLEGKYDYKVDFDQYEYTRHRLYMQTGNIIDCTFRISAQIIDEVYELFGKEARMEKDEENTYLAYVKAPEKSLIYFACQYVQHVVVISPINVREAVKKVIDEAHEKYKLKEEVIKMSVREEYAALNGKTRNGYVYQDVDIDDSLIDEVSIKEALDKYAKEDVVLYFGAPWCPWCRQALPVLVQYAEQNGQRITYVDLDGKRPVYKKTEDGFALEDAGHEDFHLLVATFGPILKNAVAKEGDEVFEVPDAKTVSLPLVVFGDKGVISGYHYGSVDLKEGQTAYNPLDSEQIAELLHIFVTKDGHSGPSCTLDGKCE